MSPQPAGSTAPRIFVAFLNATFAAALSPILLYRIVSIFYRQPMSYNEGWNVFFVSKALAGMPLYVPLDRFPLTPLNYPPFSYFMIGALSALTGDILLTGRVVTLLSSIIVAWMIYGIVKNATGQSGAALFAALFWLCLMAQFAPARLVLYDPQMLAHVFSVGALFLYSRWRAELTSGRAWILAAVCCCGIFIKHLLVAVPAALAAALFLENRRAFGHFAFGGIVIGGVFTSAWAAYGGRPALANFLDAGRPVANARLYFRLAQMRRFLIVVLAQVLLLLANFRRDWTLYVVYFSVSFLLAVYTSRGVGIDTNAWFDTFIASALLCGIFAARLPLWSGGESKWRAALAYLVLSAALLPLLSGLPNALRRSTDYRGLRRSEEVYRRDVALLRSIPGPALFESLLLGYDAGKEFILEPFNIAQLIAARRIPENLLTDAIEQRRFGAIVLDADLDDALRGARYLSFTTLTRWTPGTLAAIAENYRRLPTTIPQIEPKERSRRYFYVPRAAGDKGSRACLSGRSAP